SSEQTKDTIEDSYLETLHLLEAHLDEERPYLFGGRPAFADFGLAAQLYECGSDPTPGAILREEAPRTAAWVERMLAPEARGAFEAREALLPTLEPLLGRQVGRLFLPWTLANARALEDGEESLAVDLDGRPWTQAPQKYHAKSLGALRRRYAAVAGRSHLDPVLERTGCRDALEAAA
ncbi:MAG: glutathione S-transferase C-terminal domain-containing protein, partial [Myxococcota bacterium]|nr:glutathione S-transferase C-terminal domain-containing protein [Myxococcota bacterium]